MVARGQEGIDYKGTWGDFWSHTSVSYLDCGVDTWMYTFFRLIKLYIQNDCNKIRVLNE